MIREPEIPLFTNFAEKLETCNEICCEARDEVDTYQIFLAEDIIN